ncbi:uncharacterized protein LOC110986830 isoform X2 [Acanthaster planci]|nr:uncharacterized protein LOC110986830 isoform X2 [Acanthaster planci]
MIIETVIEPMTGHSTPQPGPLARGIYALILVLFEVLIQTVAFAGRHFNTTKQFPISTATLVLSVELTKFALCYLAFCVQHRRLRFMPSPVFLLPAVFFVTANNLFFHCLNYIPPPTWNVLLQSRLVFAALASYVIVGRPLGRWKWLAMITFLLAATLAVLLYPEVGRFKPAYEKDKKDDTARSLWWVIAAVFGVTCSAFSHDSAEYVSKLCSRPITEKYIQLYFFSTVLAVTWAELKTNGNLLLMDMKMFFPLDFYLSILNLIVGTLCGLAVTSISTSRLSSLADEASFITAWISPLLFLASTLACWLVFPKQQGYPYAVTALIFVFMGIASFLFSIHTSPLSQEQRRVGLPIGQEA